MDENDLQTNESEEENLRAMEKDIDEFLSSIRENISTNTDLQNEGTHSKVSNEYDLVSSDDCFESEHLPSRSDDLGIQGPASKVHCRPFKKKFDMGKGNVKKYKKHRLQGSYSHEEWERHSGKSGQYSGNEHYDQRSFSRSWRDEYDPDMSPSQRSDGFHQEKSPSPRGDYYQRRSFSQGKRNEHQDVRSLSQNRKGNYRQQRWFIPKGGHRYKRRNFYPEEMDEPSQGSSTFNERNFHHKRTIASLRSSDDDDDDESHRVHSRGSRSAIDWSESYDYDSDFEDQDSNQPWGLEEEYPYMEEDRDDHNAVSFITACLQRAIAYNPAVATKVTEACMALLNKPTDGLDENAYEWDRDPYTTHDEESGRVSPQSWRSRRSPSFTESVGTSSSRSGFSRRSDRFHGHSEKRVLEHFVNSDERQAGRDKYNYSSRHKKARYSPDYKRRDDKRPTAASETEKTRMRSASEYTKSHHDEEFNLKGAVSWSIRKIRKKCEAESSSTIRRALLALVEVHERECKMYMKKPEAHPDHRKEYREFVNQKTKSIIDLGGDPNGYDFEQDWKKYWPVQMYKLFQESWNTKMHSCTSLLKKKCRSSSKSSHSSSRKSAVKHPREKRHKAHKQGSKRETVKVQESIKKTFKIKQELVESTCSNLEDLQSTETNTAMLCEKHEEINKEIFSILKLLNHIKHRFNDCEASFNKLYNKAINLKEDNVAINDILQRDLPLLEKIDENLSETLEDDNLTLIQKVVIQETLERFRSFLKKSKEMKSKEFEVPKVIGNTDTSVDGTEEEHQIPCHLTSSYSSVISENCSKEVTVPLYASCSCCRTNQQVSQPRILTEISLQGSSGPQSRSLFTSKNASGGSLLLCHSQDKINFNNITSDVTSADQQASRPRRMLTEISLVGSSCPASNATEKHNVIMAGKDSGMTQPPPPGVTPPPPGITPPPPGVTPPPPGVTPPHRVTSPPGVTSPPCGVTPSPCSVTLSPSGITPPPSVRLSPSTVTPQLPDVTPSCDTLPSSSSSPSSGITPSHGVTVPPPGISTPPHSVITTSSSVTTEPHNVAPSSAATSPHYNVSPQPSLSTSDAALISRVTPPGVSLSSDCLNSSVLTVSQAPGLGSSPPAASVPQSPLPNDKTHVASQHLSTKFTTLEQDCNPLKTLKTKVTGIASQADMPPQPSKEVLRNTIKDCFLSSTLPEETSVIKSTKGVVLASDTATKGSSVASLPSLPEDFLKMFEVKPEDNFKVKSDDKSSAEMGNTGSSIKSAEKKPIKITIPQFSRQKSMLELNPITDDQELF